MLSFLRNQSKGILIIVAAIIIVAFAFLYDPNKDQFGTQNSRLSVAGKDVSHNEYKRIVSGRALLLQGLQQWNYVINLDGLDRRWGSMDGGPNTDDYVVNTILVEKEAERLGIKVSQQEIEETVKGLYQFQQNGAFNEGAWENFLNTATRFGYNEPAILKLVGQTIAYQKLRDLVTAGVAPSPREIQESYEDKHSKIFAATIAITEASVEEGVEVTDDEIKTHFEENKDNYNAPEKRGVKYVYFAKPKKKQAVPAAEGQEATPGESDEEFKARQDAFIEVVAEFDRRVANPAEGESFKSISAEEKYTSISSGVIAHEPFAKETPPDGLLEKQLLVDNLFTTLASRELGIPFDDPDGYYFFKIDGIVEPQPLTLEEAKPQITEGLFATKLATAVNEAATAARATITTALGEGKTIQGAAADAGVEAVDVPMFASGQPPVGVADAQLVQTTAAGLAPGEISQPVDTTGGALLVYLASREQPLDVDEEAMKAVIKRSTEAQDEQAVFTAWFTARKTLGNPQVYLDAQPLPPAL